MTYELINPSDTYIFEAPNREVAALAVGMINTMYGARTENDDPLWAIPFLGFSDPEKWYIQTFGRTICDGLDALASELADALDSFTLCGFKQYRFYQAACNAIDDPAKKQAFIAEWDDAHRSSINNIGEQARQLAKMVRETITGKEVSP